ncbi:MAG: formylglycine-generating enzyme family protein [Verrucomicrobia bacterium]|nr:formylglycine-generating enzyme family protein [Verrucomicrobiota bacterium]
MKLEMVLVPAGSFIMGSDKGDKNEKLPHKVNITRPFYLGKFEVTQAQWQAVMGTNWSHFVSPQKPADTLNRTDCRTFAKKLNTRFPGRNFRLPTEAEWEYACRAGSPAAYGFGDDPAALGDYAWFIGNKDEKTGTHPVGRKTPNAWGLYDMHGNVFEWCAEGYAHDYDPKEQTDPTGVKDAEWGVVRGGAWNFGARSCRSSTRVWLFPYQRVVVVGCRIACDAQSYGLTK